MPVPIVRQRRASLSKLKIWTRTGFTVAETFNGTGEVTEDFAVNANGWSNGGRSRLVDGNAFLGNFADSNGQVVTEKTFSFAEGTPSVSFQFDLLEIDSWDGEEMFVMINGEKVSLGNFYNDQLKAFSEADSASGTQGNISWQYFSVLPEAPAEVEGAEPAVEGAAPVGEHFVGSSRYTDERHVVTITIDNPVGSSVTLGFGSTLDQGDGDESFGIDNLIAPTAKVQEVASLRYASPADPSITNDEFGDAGASWADNTAGPFDNWANARTGTTSDGVVYLRGAGDSEHHCSDIRANVCRCRWCKPGEVQL